MTEYCKLTAVREHPNGGRTFDPNAPSVMYCAKHNQRVTGFQGLCPLGEIEKARDEALQAIKAGNTEQQKRCDNCKHWDTEPYGQGAATGLGVRKCSGISQAIDIHSEVMERLERESRPKTDYWTVSRTVHAEEKAFTEDASAAWALLVTRPDFFCAKFEPRE